jgi:hypothetical protein
MGRFALNTLVQSPLVRQVGTALLGAETATRILGSPKQAAPVAAPVAAHHVQPFSKPAPVTATRPPIQEFGYQAYLDYMAMSGQPLPVYADPRMSKAVLLMSTPALMPQTAVVGVPTLVDPKTLVAEPVVAAPVASVTKPAIENIYDARPVVNSEGAVQVAVDVDGSAPAAAPVALAVAQNDPATIVAAVDVVIEKLAVAFSEAVTTIDAQGGDRRALQQAQEDFGQDVMAMVQMQAHVANPGIETISLDALMSFVFRIQDPAVQAQVQGVLASQVAANQPMAVSDLATKARGLIETLEGFGMDSVYLNSAWSNVYQLEKRLEANPDAMMTYAEALQYFTFGNVVVEGNKVSIGQDVTAHMSQQARLNSIGMMVLQPDPNALLRSALSHLAMKNLVSLSGIQGLMDPTNNLLAFASQSSLAVAAAGASADAGRDSDGSGADDGTGGYTN